MTMLKPKKPQSDDGSQNAGRVRLPEEQGIRPNKGIRDLLEQAREKQGTQFELPWTTSQPGQRFILTIKWDKGMNDPIWTLYEETPGDSRIVWSQPFAPSDMDFMYDVLSMSAGSTAVADKSALADLKPTAEQLAAQEEQMQMDKANGGKIKHGQTPAPAKPEPAAAPAPPPVAPAAQAPAAAPPVYPPQPAPGYPPPVAPIPPGYMYPPQPMQAPPGYPQAPMPYVHPSQMPYAQPPAQAFPPLPAPPQPYPPAAPPVWNYGSPSQGSAAGSIAALQPSIDPTADRGPKVPVEMDLRNKRPGILLGALLTEAGLITEPTLEAALKIQEFVNDGRLDVTRGPELLKLFYSMGAAIEEYIDPSDLITPAKRQAALPPTQNRPNQGQSSGAPRSSNAPGPNKDLSAALELLTKAGILTDSDIKTANGVRAKHGGDVRAILQAAGKVDAKTMDAAVICIRLEQEGSFKFEQAMIALNYCSRSRVGFDEALEEMGWPNPRKPR